MQRLLLASLAAVGLAWCANVATAQEKTKSDPDSLPPALLLIPPAPAAQEKPAVGKDQATTPVTLLPPGPKTPEKTDPPKEKLPPLLAPPTSTSTATKGQDVFGGKGAEIVPASVAVRAHGPLADVAGLAGGNDGGPDGCHGGFFADVGIGIVRPFWKQNPAFYADRFAPDKFTTRQQDFLFDGQFTPSVRVGWISADGLGFRLGWWGFAHSDSAESPRDKNGDEVFTSAAPLGLSVATFGTPTDPHVLHVHGRVSVSVWDFEVVHQFCLDQWAFELAGGLRYAYLRHEYQARVFEDGTEISSLWSHATTNAGGPTLAIDTLRRIGQTNFGVYSTARGSVLFASGRHNSGVEFDDFDFTQRASRNSQEVLPIGELEVGVAWQRCLAGRVHLLLRTGVNGQIWGNAGNTSRSDNIDGGSTYDSNMGLLGFNFRLGVEY